MWDDTKGTFLSVLFLLLMSLFLLQPVFYSLLHGDVTGLQNRIYLFGGGGVGHFAHRKYCPPLKMHRLYSKE